MSEVYIAPVSRGDAFHCPHCQVYAHQLWYDIAYGVKSPKQFGGFIDGLSLNFCQKCSNFSLWLGEKMLFPVSSIAPLPSADMPQDVKVDFEEARNIVNASPRASSALLRLALQKLMVHLGESGKNINNDIANLVAKGLSTTIQKALDSVRVIGNNAVHAGELDLKDDEKTAIALFKLVNIIIKVMITQPKEVDEMYQKIPNGAKEAIKKRDKGTA